MMATEIDLHSKSLYSPNLALEKKKEKNNVTKIFLSYPHTEKPPRLARSRRYLLLIADPPVASPGVVVIVPLVVLFVVVPRGRRV